MLLRLLPILATCQAYRFLIYSPRFGNSHVRFMSTVADVLIDAGHEVTLLTTQVDTQVGGVGTVKPQIIDIPQCEGAHKAEQEMGKLLMNMWAASDPFTELKHFETLFDACIKQCNATIRTPGLIDSLRNMKFDVGVTETLDTCAFGIFEMLGLEKIAIAQSLAIVDGGFFFTETPSNPAYVPSKYQSLMGSDSDERMSFFRRVGNTLSFLAMNLFTDWNLAKTQEVYEQFKPGFRSLREVMKETSLIFMNSDPLLDFSRPTTHRIIDVGGITVPNERAELNQTWSTLLDLRPHTVILSFGTFIQSHVMPDEYKQTILSTFKKFPNVTFIWKYEKPEHNVAKGIDNVVTTTWLPQRDLLRDPRLSIFITHGGQGSVTEANNAGVPLIVIPVVADQRRNANQAMRNGLAVILAKEDLEREGKLEEAIRTVLEDTSYRKKARDVAQLLKDRPFDPRELLVRNMEFLAAHGPLEQLRHYGAQLNFVQYYLIDVVLFLSSICLIFVFGVIFFSVKLVKCFTFSSSSSTEKVKKL